MEKPGNPPGIKEIAKLAGVSIGTVDRVLHNRGRVSKETADKIRKIIAEVDYRPNLMARGLSVRKPRTVILVMPERSDEYWEQAFAGISGSVTEWQQSGISLAPLYYPETDRESFLKIAENALELKPCGIILAPNFLAEGKLFTAKCRELKIPVVTFDTALPGSDTLCSIGTDSRQAGRIAAELLTLTASRKGRLAVIHFDEDAGNSPQMIEKEKGFTGWLKKESKDRKYLVSSMNNSRNSYTDQLDALFENNRISGIFVTTSRTYRVARYFAEKGISDVPLVGFDLVSRNLKYLKSGYITFLINQAPGEQAAEALSVLASHLVYSEIPKKELLFRNEIITASNIPV